MKAITLHQPWATLIALSLKQYETRSWPTSYRGPLMIHAGKNMTTIEGIYIGVQYHKKAGAPLQGLTKHFIDAIKECGRYDHFTLQMLPLGAVVAVVDLLDVLPTLTITGVTERENAFGNFAPGRFAWKLENVRMLAAPIYTRGYQGLWDPSDDLIQHVMQDKNVNQSSSQ